MRSSVQTKPKVKKPRIKKTETEIVHTYVDKIIKGKVSRGHVDKRFGYTKSAQKRNKDLWLDTDFYFSVCFQSAEQKYEFLDALFKKTGVKVETSPDDQIQIVNGLKLSEALSIPIQKETMLDYPYGDLDLRPFVLDNEKF